MKKRVFSALICAVIAALSILTAFSGCTGTSYPKVVADRDEFFSKISGRYGAYYTDKNIYIFEDGTFQLNDCNSDGIIYTPSNPAATEGNTLILYNYNGAFKTVYQDSEFTYHAEISQLKKSFYLEISPLYELSFDYAEKGIIDPTLNEYRIIYSNDILYIFAPGMPISELQLDPLNHIDNGDFDGDGKLDTYLIDNHNKSNILFHNNNDIFVPHENINNGFWVDYNSSASTIDVYTFSDSEVNVVTYDLSENKLTQTEIPSDKPKPLYYRACGSSLIVLYDNKKANVICPTNDINQMKYYTEATDGSSKNPHKFIHYDKLPDYNTIIKEKNGNQ